MIVKAQVQIPGGATLEGIELVVEALRGHGTAKCNIEGRVIDFSFPVLDHAQDDVAPWLIEIGEGVVRDWSKRRPAAIDSDAAAGTAVEVIAATAGAGFLWRDILEELRAAGFESPASPTIEIDGATATNMQTVVFKWSTEHGTCYDCGRPAAFAIEGEGPLRDDLKRCGVCAANAAVDGETIVRIGG